MLSIYGNYFKTVRKAFQIKLVERKGWQRVATLKNIKYILICLTLFWLLHDSICVISSLLFYNGENSNNKENPLNESVCDWYCRSTLKWYFGISLGCPLAVVKAAATLPGVHTEHDS